MKQKRVPASLAPTSKSRPKGPPTSTWSLISKSNSRGVPQRRTSTFSVSSLPTGTEGSGRFGIVNRRSFRAFLTAAFLPSKAAKPSAIAAPSFRSSVASWPAFLAAPIFLATWLRRAWSSSVSVWIALRSPSKASYFSVGNWNLRVAKRATTSGKFLRRRFESSM